MSVPPTSQGLSTTLAMPFFTNPTSFRNANLMAPLSLTGAPAGGGLFSQSPRAQAQMARPLPPHASHPALPHLTLLVFEAVLEVVCVSLPGYIVAKSGMFTAEMQKFTANLNVAVFTPCLSTFLPTMLLLGTDMSTSLH